MIAKFRRIVTHVNPDIDAACSVWAAIRWVCPDADVEFRSAATTVFGAEEFPVDIGPNKGPLREDGKRGSCFATMMERYAPQEDREALRHITEYVDIHDSYADALWEIAPNLSARQCALLGATSLMTVFRAVRYVSKSSHELLRRWRAIMNGLLGVAKLRAGAEKEAEDLGVVMWMPGDTVAIVNQPRFTGTTGVLFDKGARAVVYVDGNGLGVIRNDREVLRADHPDIVSVVRDCGEESEWFSHSSGFLYCWSSKKAPKDHPSKVDPMDLALAASNVFNGKRVA